MLHAQSLATMRCGRTSTTGWSTWELAKQFCETWISGGGLVIPITSEPARLSAMLALETEQDPKGEEDEGEGEPRGPELLELSGHVRLRNGFVTLLRGECKFVQVAVEDHHGAALRETSFVASEKLDEMVAGVKLAERRALFETDADGFCSLMVKNEGEHPYEFDKYDSMCAV